MREEFETCPGCGAVLPRSPGPLHRYLGASPACWEIFSRLNNAGQPPIAPDPANALLIDAYAVQHPGRPSDQSIQSVAVHLLALFGVFAGRIGPEQAVWLRRRVLREGPVPKHKRFRWLTPPPFTDSLTIADVAAGPNPEARAELARRYVADVWTRWEATHGPTIAEWYERYA